MESKKSKILIVDDEPDVVETLKHFLSLKGYDVSGALSGEEALSILEREKKDLILLDIMMSGIKGGELARIVRGKFPNIKIIIVTGYSHEIEGLAREHLLDGSFIKPVNIAELYNKLVETLGEKAPLVIDLKSKQGIRGRLLLIKAKLLFIEPLHEVYNFLSAHFKELSNKGEYYETELAASEKEVMLKAAAFNPDILVANASFIESHETAVITGIPDKELREREIIIYNINDISKPQDTRLAELTKAVEITCLKKGLVEIKWVEI